jgi:hypothetical protein
MNDFSVKQYLIDNNLVTKEGEFICRNTLVNPAWGLGPFDKHRMMIYLCTLVHFFEDKCMLDNLTIEIRDCGDQDYALRIDEKDRRYDYAHPNFDWSIVLDTIEFLLPHMASSNVSYLAGMFYDL